MNFAAAAGLWLSLLALPVVVLYILKIKRHRRDVPYLRLWVDLLADQVFSTLFQRLQRWLSLLLQLLILACLVGAFAVLTLSDSFLREDSVVLVVDTGASMAGREKPDATRRRFDAAVAAARDLVEGRSAEDEIAVIAAGAQPEVLLGFSRSTLRLREACDALAPSRASSDLRAAHRLARDLLAEKKHKRVLLLSDAAGGAADALTKEDADLRWVRIGESVDNVGIVRFQARKNHAVGTDYLLLVVQNFGATRHALRVEIGLEGVTKKVLPLDLAPGAEHRETLELSLPEGGFAKAELVFEKTAEGTPGRDGLGLDDVAYAAVPPSRLYRVALVTPDAGTEAPFKAALGAMGAIVDHTGSQGMDLATWQAKAEEYARSFDLVVFAGAKPEALPEAGNFLCVNVLPGGLPAEELGLEARPAIRDFDADHPLARFLEPKSLSPASARPIDLRAGRVFLSTVGGPVGVVFQSPTRKVVYLGLDVLSDLFFLQVAFPILVRNVFTWIHEQESELLDATYRPGEVMRARFSVADPSVELGWRHEWSRAEGTVRVPVVDGRFAFADTAEPGRYWVRTRDRDFRTTVNLFDASESDLAMPEAAADADLGVERAGFLFGRDLWPLLLLGACGLWLLEWGLFHRRLTE